MIFTKALKRIRFSFDTDTKKFYIVELNRGTSSTGDFQPNVITSLTIIEACSFVRFAFSIIQYHLPRKVIRMKIKQVTPRARPKAKINIKPKE